MIYGVIDIGSNTIRLSIYKAENTKDIQLLLHKKNMASLANHIEDKRLTAKGQRIAANVLCNFKSILDNFAIKNVHVFGTASLRNIINTEEVVRYLEQISGFKIDVISGEEEAVLDFVGAAHALSIDEGILIDMGGASTEFVEYKDAQIVSTRSLDFGSLFLYKHFVSNLLPLPEEVQKIKDYVRRLLEKEWPVKKTAYPVICGIGGTIRSVNKLDNELFELDDNNKEILTCHLKKILKKMNKNEKSTLNVLLQVAPDRIRTILPGLIALEVCSSYFQSEKILVSSYGVREGYLYHKILKKVKENECRH